MIVCPREKPDLVVDRIGWGQVYAHHEIVRLVSVAIDRLLAHSIDGRIAITLNKFLRGTLHEDATQGSLNNDEPQIPPHLLVGENTRISCRLYT